MAATIIFGVALATGYVLGTQANRQQYERLVAATRDLTDDLGLQSAAGALTGRASEFFAGARRHLP